MKILDSSNSVIFSDTIRTSIENDIGPDIQEKDGNIIVSSGGKGAPIRIWGIQS